MSDNNEADALFATRRKKQQDEEAQRAAQQAEKERLEELERQRQAMVEDIKRLETLQAEQKAQAEQNALEAQKNREAQEKLLAAQAAEKEAKKAEKKAAFENSPLKKYLPFIIAGAGVLVLIIVIVVVISMSSKKDDKKSDADQDQYTEDDVTYTLADDMEVSEWRRIQNDTLGVSFICPEMFVMDEESSLPEGGYYEFVFKEELPGYDDYVGQNLKPATYKVFYMFVNDDVIKESLMEIINEIGLNKDLYEIEKDKTSGLSYTKMDIDKLGAGEPFYVEFIGQKGDIAVGFTFYSIREQAGNDRYVGMDDLLYIAQVIFNSLSVG